MSKKSSGLHVSVGQTELLGSEFLGNRRKSGRLDLSHSIKTVALKLTARSAEEPNSLYRFTIRIYIHTRTLTRLRWQTVRSTGKPSNFSLAQVTGFVALAKAEITEKDDIQLFADSFAVTTEKENSI